MNFVLWLAQAAPTPQEGIGMAKDLADAGVAVICLFIAGVAGIFAFYQLRRNNTLEKDFRERIDADAKALREEQKTLMREMIASEKASRETILQANRSVETFERTLSGLCEQVSSLKTLVDTKSDLIVDEVRRIKP